VRNGDGTAHEQGNVQGFDYLSAAPADFAAADQVIGNAVIAAQDCGSDQAEEGMVPPGRPQQYAWVDKECQAWRYTLWQKVLDNRNLAA